MHLAVEIALLTERAEYMHGRIRFIYFFFCYLPNLFKLFNISQTRPYTNIFCYFLFQATVYQSLVLQNYRSQFSPCVKSILRACTYIIPQLNKRMSRSSRGHVTVWVCLSGLMWRWERSDDITLRLTTTSTSTLQSLFVRQLRTT